MVEIVGKIVNITSNKIIFYPDSSVINSELIPEILPNLEQGISIKFEIHTTFEEFYKFDVLYIPKGLKYKITLQDYKALKKKSTDNTRNILW